jgi:hypothetical protein
MSKTLNGMKIAGDNYKGIDFIRIATLPDDQKLKIRNSFDNNKIIKILREKELLNDCIQYSDYNEWYYQHFNSNTVERLIQKTQPKRLIITSAFKPKKVLS